jgi:hypothetical protein
MTQLATVVTATRKLKALDFYRAFSATGLVNTVLVGGWITQLATFVTATRKLKAWICTAHSLSSRPRGESQAS